MGRQIRVRAIKKERPDIHLYVLALIALARQLREQEAGPDVAPKEATDERG